MISQERNNLAILRYVCDSPKGFWHGTWQSSPNSGMQGFIQRGGRGGFIPLMILARGGYPPHQTAEQCFFLMGILVKSFKKVFRRQIPFFSKFVFSNCPPHKKFSGGNPGMEPGSRVLILAVIVAEFMAE